MVNNHLESVALRSVGGFLRPAGDNVAVDDTAGLSLEHLLGLELTSFVLFTGNDQIFL